jgi:hypothetical protein
MFLFYLYCWGFAAASRFTLYSTIVSLLLVEVFFSGIFPYFSDCPQIQKQKNPADCHQQIAS